MKVNELKTYLEEVHRTKRARHIHDSNVPGLSKRDIWRVLLDFCNDHQRNPGESQVPDEMLLDVMEEFPEITTGGLSCSVPGTINIDEIDCETFQYNQDWEQKIKFNPKYIANIETPVNHLSQNMFLNEKIILRCIENIRFSLNDRLPPSFIKGNLYVGTVVSFNIVMITDELTTIINFGIDSPLLNSSFEVKSK